MPYLNHCSNVGTLLPLSFPQLTHLLFLSTTSCPTHPPASHPRSACSATHVSSHPCVPTLILSYSPTHILYHFPTHPWSPTSWPSSPTHISSHPCSPTILSYLPVHLSAQLAHFSSPLACLITTHCQSHPHPPILSPPAAYLISAPAHLSHPCPPILSPLTACLFSSHLSHLHPPVSSPPTCLIPTHLTT